MIDNFILSELQLKCVSDHIDVIWTDGLDIFTPPAVSVKRKKIVMNLSWFNQRELAFQLGHEMSHIYHDDPDDRLLYYSSRYVKNTIEIEANAGALDLILPYYIDERNVELINPVDFMREYAIPPHLETVVIKKLANYGKL